MEGWPAPVHANFHPTFLTGASLLHQAGEERFAESNLSPPMERQSRGPIGCYDARVTHEEGQGSFSFLPNATPGPCSNAMLASH